MKKLIVAATILFGFAASAQPEVPPLVLVKHQLAKLMNTELTDSESVLYGRKNPECRVIARLDKKTKLPQVLLKVLDRTELRVLTEVFYPSHSFGSKTLRLSIHELSVLAFESCGDSECEEHPQTITFGQGYVEINKLRCNY